MTQQVHVAVTRTVKPGCEEEFETSIRTFFANALKDSPTSGALLLMPFPGSYSRTYGILRSFPTEKDRQAFYQSDLFHKWEEAVKPLVEGDYARQNLHGLEAFFANPALVRHPPRWKMAIVTWAGVWPAVYVVSLLIGSRLVGLGNWFATGVATFLVVVILTWGVMPVLTRLVRPWLTSSTERWRAHTWIW